MPTSRTESDLPDSCYGYVPDGPKSDRKLRLCSLETGTPDAGIVGAAAAALGPGYRGQRVELPSGEKEAAVRKVRAAWRKLHPDADPDEMPSGIHMAESGVPDEAPVPLAFGGEGDPADDSAARPLLFAVPQEWIAFLPRPGKYRHPLYGEVDLTGDRNARMVANFAANVYGQDPPINAEHDGRSSGAVGWIKGMRLAADGSIEVRPEWNERGKALLSGDRFRYVSAEFFDRWQHPVTGDWHEDVPVGLAICTRPHFKTDVLRPLAASEEAALVMRVGDAPPEQAGGAGEETVMADDQPTTTQDPPADAAPATTTTTTADRPPDPVVRQLTEAAAQEFAELRRTAQRLEEENKRLAEDRTRLLAESRVKRFTAEVRGLSDANGKPYVGHIPDHVRMLCDLEEAFGAGSWHVQHYQGLNRAHAEQMEQSTLFREMGVGRGTEATTTAEDQIAAMAREVAARSPGTTYAKAFAEVLEGNPELRAAHARERRQGRS